ncbi:MAG: ATP-binding cassette domain-containing protein [Halioglobus sp.]
MSNLTTEPLICVSGLEHFYGSGKLRQQILKDISTEIHAGEIIILTGPSGSGKTTLLTLLGALRSAQHGSLKIFGNELAGASSKVMQSVRRQIGYIFQSHNLIDALSVSQNVAMSLHLHSDIKRAQARSMADDMLDAVGLAEHKGKYPNQLSGGQKQRVGIARALVAKPRIVLADEPTASLDRHSGREVVELMRKLAKEQQVTVIIVTHDSRILDVADRILHLEDGSMQSLSSAIAENTSQLLSLLEKHDPDRSHFISTFSNALARVAFADNVIADEERHVMRKALQSTSGLSEAEVDLVVELAMAQVRMTTDREIIPERAPFTEVQRDQVLESLFAVAKADGVVTEDEREEIQDIARELGFPAD